LPRLPPALVSVTTAALPESRLVPIQALRRLANPRSAFALRPRYAGIRGLDGLRRLRALKTPEKDFGAVILRALLANSESVLLITMRRSNTAGPQLRGLAWVMTDLGRMRPLGNSEPAAWKE
jgi:hypothetical protein